MIKKIKNISQEAISVDGMFIPSLSEYAFYSIEEADAASKDINIFNLLIDSKIEVYADSNKISGVANSVLFLSQDRSNPDLLKIIYDLSLTPPDGGRFGISPGISGGQSYNNSIKIKERKEYADDLMERFKAKNISEGISLLQGMHMHSRMRKLSVSISGLSFDLDVLNMAVSGDIEIACVALQYATPDDMSLPYHWLSSARLSWLVSDMKTFLGWP